MSDATRPDRFVVSESPFRRGMFFRTAWAGQENLGAAEVFAGSLDEAVTIARAEATRRGIAGTLATRDHGGNWCELGAL